MTDPIAEAVERYDRALRADGLTHRRLIAAGYLRRGLTRREIMRRTGLSCYRIDGIAADIQREERRVRHGFAASDDVVLG